MLRDDTGIESSGEMGVQISIQQDFCLPMGTVAPKAVGKVLISEGHLVAKTTLAVSPQVTPETLRAAFEVIGTILRAKTLPPNASFSLDLIRGSLRVFPLK